MVYLNPKLLPHQSKQIDKLYEMVFQFKEIVLYGPTECAKSFECLKLAHALCSLIPNFRCVILRKAKTTIYSTALQTLKDHILPYGLIESPDNPIISFGGPRNPSRLIYKKTGAEMWLLGEDDKTGKALGTEWDLAVYSQCEQSAFTFWQELSGRCTGRAGNWVIDGRRHGLLLGECNPASSKHFLRVRWQEDRCQMLKFQHVDNAQMYYDGEYTGYGKDIIAELKRKYTGHLYERFYLGNWVGVSGAVYAQEYDPNIHDVEEQQILDEMKDDWEWSMSMDFGFNHPFVCVLFCGPPDLDENGNRKKLYSYKEIYKTGLDPDETKMMVHNLIDRYVPKNKELSWTVADHKPEYHKSLEKIGIPMENAEKEVLPGIQVVKECLHNNKIFFNKDSLVHPPDEEQQTKGNPTRSVDEFEVYAYKPVEKQTGAQNDELPIPLHDDYCDALRYELVKWSVPYIEPHVVSRVLPPPNF